MNKKWALLIFGGALGFFKYNYGSIGDQGNAFEPFYCLPNQTWPVFPFGGMFSKPLLRGAPILSFWSYVLPPSIPLMPERPNHFHLLRTHVSRVAPVWHL